MPVYYNENDSFAAAWLRNLISEGLIAPGDVDERDIREVRGSDIEGYEQCHFFAGIGGWSYALRLAGWADGRPVWSGSCPCQPFSAAGRRGAADDERHLWPAFHRLIAECRPATVFGEQVASALGRTWLAAVRSDLEHLGYAVGAADLPAAGVGAPHIRQRLWWVADSAHADRRAGKRRTEARTGENAIGWGRSGRHSDLSGLADADGRDAGTEGLQRGGQQRQQPQDGGAGRGVADDQEHGRRQGCAFAQGRAEGIEPQRAGLGPADHGGIREFWSDLVWLPCADGKARPTQPSIFPLAHGLSGGRLAVGSAVQQAFAALSQKEAEHLFNRVGTLRGAGNAIVPQVAAEFIKAYQEVIA